MDLDFLAALAFTGMTLNMIDFLLPVVCNSIYNPKSWTNEQDKEFEKTCESVAALKQKIVKFGKRYMALRTNSPVMVSSLEFC